MTPAIALVSSERIPPPRVPATAQHRALVEQILAQCEGETDELALDQALRVAAVVARAKAQHARFVEETAARRRLWPV